MSIIFFLFKRNCQKPENEGIGLKKMFKLTYKCSFSNNNAFCPSDTKDMLNK